MAVHKRSGKRSFTRGTGGSTGSDIPVRSGSKPSTWSIPWIKPDADSAPKYRADIDGPTPRDSSASSEDGTGSGSGTTSDSGPNQESDSGNDPDSSS